MALIKTEAGQRAFKERSALFSPQQRSAYIFFDGRRSINEVLRSAGALGITAEDIQTLVDHGLLAWQDAPSQDADMAGRDRAAMVNDAAGRLEDDALAPLPTAANGTFKTASEADLEPLSEAEEVASRQARYQAAYQVARQLTASLGLRGFRLNLAVEAAGDFERMLELAPKIREAVGAEKFEPLRRALLR